jgi:hypothetical protein
VLGGPSRTGEIAEEVQNLNLTLHECASYARPASNLAIIHLNEAVSVRLRAFLKLYLRRESCSSLFDVSIFTSACSVNRILCVCLPYPCVFSMIKWKKKVHIFPTVSLTILRPALKLEGHVPQY